MLSRHVTRYAVFLLLLGSSVLYAILQLYHRHNVLSNASNEAEPFPWHQGLPQSDGKGENPKSFSICETYPDLGDIAISVKTGATEALEKLPAILSTSLSCVRDVMVFSDLEQKLGDLQIHDVISRFSPELMKDNPDFEIYWKQKQFVSEHREDEIKSLSQLLAPARDWRTKNKSASWGLDKYKFLHMLEMAYELQPDRDWYVFLEADTYLSWPNFKRWVAELDSTRKLYLGNAMKKSDSRAPLYFAHGGSGFVLSGAALKEFAVDRKGVASRKDPHAHKWWAGDIMLADVLYDELSLQVTNAEPMFSALGPKQVAFGEDSWCQPVITLHHMTAVDFNEIHELETKQDSTRLLLRDVYAHAYPDGLPAKGFDWDNIADARPYSLDPQAVSSDGSKLINFNANGNFEACQMACEQLPTCFQFFFRNTTVLKAETGNFEFQHQCLLSRAFRLGHEKPSQSLDNPDEPGTARSWTSGWQSDRIAKWVREHWECPEADHP